MIRYRVDVTRVDEYDVPVPEIKPGRYHVEDGQTIVIAATNFACGVTIYNREETE